MNDERQEWIDAYLEGTASPKTLAALDRALCEDEGLRNQLLESSHLIAELSQVLCVEEESDSLPKPLIVRRRLLSRRSAALVATLVLGLGAFSLILSYQSGRTDPSSLILVEGWAHFGELKLDLGDRVVPPGVVVAGADSAAVLRYPDGSLLTLEEGSALRLDVGSGKDVFLEHGALVADMQPQPEGREMIMDTPNAKVTVLGTRYRLATTIIEDLLEVEHGEVRVLEKRTNRELLATHGTSNRYSGVTESIFPVFPQEEKIPDKAFFPVERYEPSRSWFTEDFVLSWTPGLWEVSTQEKPEFHLLDEPEPGVFLEPSADWKGFPTNVLNFSRPSKEGQPVRLRLSEKVGWDNYFLKYYYRVQGDDPFEQNPLCLDLPDGITMETVMTQDGPDPLRAPETFNRVVLQYLRFWNGEKWQVEVRRIMNYEHLSTVRLDIERTPEILFEVRSGGCLFDFISVGQLTPSPGPFRDPFATWMCTEDFEPSYNHTFWDVSPHDEERFYPITAPEKGAILQEAIGIKGKVTQVLSLANPSREGSPSQFRLRRRIKWDDFLVQFHFRSAGKAPLVMDPLCLDLPEGTEREILYENDAYEIHDDSLTLNKVRLEYHRFKDGGEWYFDVKRLVNDVHTSTIRINMEEMPAILFDVKSGAGIFDWIEIRMIPEETVSTAINSNP